MLNQRFYNLGAEPSAIRTLFMHGLKRKLEIGEDKVFDFSLGNPSVPAPKKASHKLQEMLLADPVELHAYSPAAGLPEVREQIAAFIKKSYNCMATAEDVFVTTGAAGGLTATLSAISNPGDEVIIIAPYFPEYEVWVNNAGCIPVKVLAEQTTFQIDVNAVKDAITDKTVAIIVNSPCNPTGAIYSEENVKELAGVLNGIYLISDEPYRKLAFNKSVPWIPNYYENTIVVDSISKSLSMPGERLGSVFVSPKCKNALEVMHAIAGASRAFGHVCAPVLFQRLYAECLNLEPDLRSYDNNRKLLCELMDELGLEYVEPEGTFYLWFKSPISDANKFSDMAKKHDLLIVPSDSFGVKGWIRIGYCVSNKTIKNSIPAWRKLMQDVNN